jgi:hypothetical protein
MAASTESSSPRVQNSLTSKIVVRHHDDLASFLTIRAWSLKRVIGIEQPKPVAALSMKSATAWGCDAHTAWLP